MRILVTGAAGFIGSNFVRWLFERGGRSFGVQRVVALDALTYAGNLANLDGIEDHYDFRFVRGDIRDQDLVASLLQEEKIEAIVNFAAESHVDRSIVDPLAFVRTNIEGTQVLLHLAMKCGVRRFLQVSTDEVYGSLGPSGYFTELSPLNPSSAYAASKTAADLLVLAAHKTHGYPVSVTRCTNNYGPYQFPEKLIPLFITNALENKPLPLYGDGKNVRSWIHVDDHSRALLLVLQQGRPGEVYNIGGGPESEKQNVEVTTLILQMLNKEPTLIRYVEDRQGHDRRYAVDYSKIKSELAWEPQVEFSQGLRDTVNWYLGERSWWEAIKTGEYLRFYESYYGKRFALNS